jgi:hypothetical protein
MWMKKVGFQPQQPPKRTGNVLFVRVMQSDYICFTFAERAQNSALQEVTDVQCERETFGISVCENS